MKDVIYRDDAIEAINKALDRETLLNRLVRKAVLDAIISIPSADRPPQGDVDAVAIFEREMHNLEQGYITLGEFDERIEPLHHLCYGRPQGEWIDRGMRVPSSWVKKCSLCGHETDTWRWCNFCPNCGSKMRGEHDD